MNIARVSLDKEEAIWVSRYILKMIEYMQNAGKRDPKILLRTTYKTLKSLDAAALLFSAGGLSTPLNRKQKLLLRELIGGVHKNLTNSILPEYKRRGGHERYILAAENQKVFFEALIRKFK